MSETTRQVIKLVSAMPDDATLDDVMAELNFKQKNDTGLTNMDEGGEIPHYQVGNKADFSLQRQGEFVAVNYAGIRLPGIIRHQYESKTTVLFGIGLNYFEQDFEELQIQIPTDKEIALVKRDLYRWQHPIGQKGDIVTLKNKILTSNYLIDKDDFDTIGVVHRSGGLPFEWVDVAWLMKPKISCNRFKFRRVNTLLLRFIGSHQINDKLIITKNSMYIIPKHHKEHKCVNGLNLNDMLLIAKHYEEIFNDG